MQRDYIYGEKAALVVVDPQRKFTLPTDDWEEIRGRTVPEINRYARLFREHGKAPTAYFVVPLVGSVFVDFVNTGVLTAFLALL